MRRMMILTIAITIAMFAVLGLSGANAGVLVDVDFEWLSSGDTISDGSRIQDVSGNGYHGFWGDASGNYDIVDTFSGGIGVDTATSAERGHVFLRDGLGGIPEAWDGGTTTRTPYFTLEATKNYTFESIVKFASTDAENAGRDGLMGQIGGNEFWIRADDGYIDYAAVSGSANAGNMGLDNIDIRSAYDGEFHNIAVVLDRSNGEIRSYLDGSLLHTNTDDDIDTMGEMLSGTEDFRLGAYNTIDDNAFTGIQDRYRISDTALSTDDFLVIPEPATVSLLFGMGIIALIRKRIMR